MQQARVSGLTLQHVPVGVVSHGEQMRRHLGSLLALVLGDHVGCVDWQSSVGVNGDAEQPGVGLHKEQKHGRQ